MCDDIDSGAMYGHEECTRPEASKPNTLKTQGCSSPIAFVKGTYRPNKGTNWTQLIKPDSVSSTPNATAVTIDRAH